MACLPEQSGIGIAAWQTLMFAMCLQLHMDQDYKALLLRPDLHQNHAMKQLQLQRLKQRPAQCWTR
jgi:hypothetical protein